MPATMRRMLNTTDQPRILLSEVAMGEDVELIFSSYFSNREPMNRHGEPLLERHHGAGWPL
jgi:hypothetical protein